MVRRDELPAVFRNVRVERRVLALELRQSAFERRVAIALAELAEGVGSNAAAVQLLGMAMKTASETLPGERPLSRELYGRN